MRTTKTVDIFRCDLCDAEKKFAFRVENFYPSKARHFILSIHQRQLLRKLNNLDAQDIEICSCCARTLTTVAEKISLTQAPVN